MRLRVLLRLLTIQRVLERHGLDELVRATHLYRPLRLLWWLSPWVWFQRHDQQSVAVRLRLALEELGPVFIKFGQAISTRRDLLPPDIADELAKLQDAVPPFSGDTAHEMVTDALGTAASQLHNFDRTPLAAASIAQVHTATLANGREVIVKVLRPGVQALIERDVEVLHQLAALADRWWPEAHRLKPREVVREYEHTILDELDLMREAANASQLRRNFAGSNQLYVPEVYWDLCRKSVMVMERIRGIPIGDLSRLHALGVNMKLLAQNGAEIFFTQVFHHNFFHADMHPGNIFVLADDPQRPRYAAVDFGIVGTLDPRDQRYLAENFLAVFNRDYHRVAALHVQSGWVPRGTRVAELESAIRTICEPIFDRPLRDISFATVLLRLFEALRRFDGQIQPQLILLQKTLFNIEGLGRQLYPDLDIWTTATPVLKRWMRERASPRRVLRGLRQAWPDMLDIAEAAPTLARRAIELTQDDALRLPTRSEDIAALRRQLATQQRRHDQLLIGIAGVAALLYWIHEGLHPRWLVGVIAAAVLWGWWRSRERP